MGISDTHSPKYLFLLALTLGEWVSQILNFNSNQEKDYIQSVIKADFAEAGDQDVFRKIKEDLKEKNVSDEDLRKKMDELNEKAKTDLN